MTTTTEPGVERRIAPTCAHPMNDDPEPLLCGISATTTRTIGGAVRALCSTHAAAHDADEMTSRLRARYGIEICEDRPAPRCPALPAREDHWCDGTWHFQGDRMSRCGSVALHRCPEVERHEVRARVAAERQRLAGVIGRSHHTGGFGFDGFDPSRQTDPADRAAAELGLAKAQEFAAARPPRRGLVLWGTNGIGKTRLLLGAYFSHLEAGVRARWLPTQGELVTMRRARNAYDADVAQRAQDAFDRLRRAAVLYLPDIGDPSAADRRRGEEADARDELTDLLDQSAAVIALATNCSPAELRDDPSVGYRLASRLLDGALVVAMTGRDQRIATATRARSV